MNIKYALFLSCLISTPLATHFIAPPLIQEAAAQEVSSVYKWVDEKGVTHYTDKFSHQQDVQVVNVDSNGSSYGSSEVFRRERQAVKGFNGGEVTKRAAYSSGIRKQGDSQYCLKVKQRISELKKIMRQGYSAQHSDYYRSKKRKLAEKEKAACRS